MKFRDINGWKVAAISPDLQLDVHEAYINVKAEPEDWDRHWQVLVWTDTLRWVMPRSGNSDYQGYLWWKETK